MARLVAPNGLLCEFCAIGHGVANLWPFYFQGQVLNQTSAWWMERTAHIIGNSVITVPDPNVTVMERCDVFPVEFVVRGFMTGVHISALEHGVCAGQVLRLIFCVRIM